MPDHQYTTNQFKEALDKAAPSFNSHRNWVTSFSNNITKLESDLHQQGVFFRFWMPVKVSGNHVHQHHLAWEEYGGKFRLIGYVTDKDGKREYTKPVVEFPVARRAELHDLLPKFIEEFAKSVDKRPKQTATKQQASISK